MASLPSLPPVAGTDPSRAVLDSFRIAIAKKVADALPPLTVEQVYAGVDYGKKGIDFTIALPRFRLPGKVDVLAKQVVDSVRYIPSIVVDYGIDTNHSSKLMTTSNLYNTTRLSSTSCAARRPSSAPS